MADLNCYITTFNCGRSLIDVDYFAANLFNGLQTNLPPDLVVLSLQEIAPIGYSFLGGSMLTPYLTRFTRAVNLAAALRTDDFEYKSVAVGNLGMTAIMVFATADVAQRIRWIETAGVGVGLLEMGNKAAIAVRLGLGCGSESEDDEVAMTVVAAHLAPFEGNCERRNLDWKSVCEGLVFESSRDRRRLEDGESEAEPLLSAREGNTSGDSRSLFEAVSHVLVAGDLNYRAADIAPQPDDHKNWPQPVESASDLHHYSHLLKQDQLNREIKIKKTLHNLAEPLIDFPPTYKYSKAAQAEAALRRTTTAVKDEGRAWLWAKHRVPSWCDRVLYLAAAPPTVQSYTALPVQPTSDHRPVSLAFSIPLKPLDLSSADVKAPFPVRKDWKEARATARNYELIVGLAAYLSLTWEGEALLAGTIVGILGGYLALRAMIGT
ncbi:hypothetical protein LTR37_007370 [Vermiconidia calcicola]|uniref:Uncharacterized protein n=1 Tax=Vermiconidia calcicola TaxID=1690605 RepID=A0ACC3NE28_9PEZI|nr:hypothetical protein LTR37_007370 [Vermiconidia calcicola]